MIKLLKFFYHRKKVIMSLHAKKLLSITPKNEPSNDTEIFEESLIFSIAVAYYLRLPSQAVDVNDKLVKPRALFEDYMDNYLKTSPLGNLKFKTILVNEMNFYIDNMTIPDSIAKNEALKENIFSIVVCVTARIPLVIIGQPGNNQWFTKKMF